jgi:hypothetical protein
MRNEMNRRGFVKGACILTALAGALPAMLLEGCESQQTIASLINTLGAAAEQLATYENNPTLAAKLQTDVAAASAAVLAWKKGTASQMVVEALNLVEDDLNLFPFAGPYVPLIDLAIGTVEAIMASLGLTPAPTAGAKPRRQVSLAYKAPKTSKDFKSKWNALAPPPVQVK